MHIRAASIAVFAFSFSLIATAQFTVATFETDVTVPMNHALMGGGIAPSKEIIDPLKAKGLILRSGEKPLVWLSVDWCEIRNDAYDEWRDALAEAIGTDRERVFLSAIHQHDAPVADFDAQARLDDVGLEKSLCDVAFVRDCIARTAEAATSALQNAQGVTHYGAGHARTQGLVSNRRVEYPDGSVHYNRTSSTPDPVRRSAAVGLVDPMLRTLSFWQGDTPVAAMHFFAVHPMSYYGRGGVSADFIGMARDKIEAETPRIPHIYFSGCSGDLVAGRYNDGRDEERAKLAERLYVAMRESYDATEKSPLDSLGFRNEALVLPMRETENFTEADQNRTLQNDSAPIFQRNLAAMGLSWRARHAAGRAIDVPSVDFGDAMFTLLPAEAFVEYQLMAQRMRPDREVFVAGYGESAPGYIPSRLADGEGFVADHSWCWVHTGAHEAMHDAIARAMGVPDAWGVLPETNSHVELPGQEWKYEPGPRTFRADVYYPDGKRSSVTPETGLMLTLHNWGGTGARGAPNPNVVAERFNVIAISADYVQSGKYDAENDPPYDFGYIQALDALRALHFVWRGLNDLGIAYDDSRIYATGGSGGGNVSLMANKLAPRTFAAIVDCSGMARLSDDIAYGYPAGSSLNAGYSADESSPRYLSTDAQLLRYVGYLPHAEHMKSLGNFSRIITMHGMGDMVCPFADKKDMADTLARAGLNVETHFIGDDDLTDPFKNTGHSVGDRTQILIHIAGQYLDPKSDECLRREGPTDFERRDDRVRYTGPNGEYIISYEAGYPVARFERRDRLSYVP